MSSTILRGIDGSNPLGFLAAIGALRLLDLVWRERGIRLGWVRNGGWRPEISGHPIEDEAELCRVLHEEAPWAPLEAFSDLGNNIKVPHEVFEGVARVVAAGASGEDRRAADFAAAFGSEVFWDDKGLIRYTDLCFITGSGHQDFLGTAKGLAESTSPEHLQEALYGPWRNYKGLSMRWDPDDAKEYALRWRDPSKSGGVFSVWGASRLAFEALALFPTVPMKGKLRTTGFRTQKRAREFTWPIWSHSASVDTVRSMIGMGELQEDTPKRSELHAMGICEVFRVQRVQIGQGANFKVSFRPSRAV